MAELSLYDSLPLPVVAADGDAVVYGNPAFLALSGLTRDELGAQRLSGLLRRWVVAVDRSWLESLLRAYHAGAANAPDGFHFRVLSEKRGERTLWARLA